MTTSPHLPAACSVRDNCYTNRGNAQVLRWVPGEAKQVLDLGCGAGDNARILAARGIAVDGVTLSSAEATAAGRVCRSVFVHNMEEGLPAGLAPSYDAILASHLLEHICFPEKLLGEIGARLSPGGVFIVAIPNLLNWRLRVRLLRGVFEYTRDGIMDSTHFRWYSFASAKRLLQQNGFEVTRAYAHGAFPLSFVRRLLPPVLVDRLDRTACAAFPGLIGYQLLYVCRSRSLVRPVAN